MKTVTIDVEFRTSFNFEYDDEVELTDELLDQEVDDLIETLSDRSNNYWRDAEFNIIYPGEPG